MNFVDAVKSALTRYVDFATRSSRSEYWWFVLFNFIVSIVFGIIDALIGTGGILQGLVSLALLIPGIAVAVRRMHDTGRSGWWVLINLIPVIGWLIFIYFAVQPGKDSDNNWGSNPLGASAG